jgi:hypothetical protein
MLRILCLCVALLLAPLSAQADIISKPEKFSRPEKSGPVRLVCFNPNGLIAHVERLTREQIIGVRFAALDGEIKWPCDDVQLPTGTVLLHERWLQSKDGWYVMAQTVQYPNGSVWVTVDPMQATYYLQPLQFRRYYPDFFVPIIPDDARDDYGGLIYRDRRESYPQSPRDKTSGMDVDEAQEHVRRQLEALRNRRQ